MRHPQEADGDTINFSSGDEFSIFLWRHSGIDEHFRVYEKKSVRLQHIVGCGALFA